MTATLLIVDDDPRNRTLLRSILESRYRIREAPDAPSALTSLSEFPADLILLDVMMPGMSGHEACGLLKATSPDRYLPVLMLTALSSQSDRNVGLQAGADDYLCKPVDRAELLLRVASFLRLREQDGIIRRQVAQLSELSALKDDLVSLLVHDLRSPLAGMRMLLELLREQTTGEAVGDVEVALRAADQMRDALEELLQVRMLEDGEVPLERESIPLSAVLGEGAARVELARRAHGVELRVHLETDIAIPVDRRLLRRALENLLHNAIKYTTHGGEVTLTGRAAGGGGEILVEDTGPGIPEVSRAHVFDKFGAVKGPKTDARRGFGLGLYMVRLVVEAHGGAVTVGERPGGGTRFRLFLPGSPRG